ncbi:hypothetical protein [Streptomyces sp. V1I1]|uniref:hypothetical protein n=1 Tax=Streptomyces sp. V1I1 TaxID=3042272 RepID=UPI002788BDF8|nr:hypothetical protein [Streptomyces sp. V1I1]MDQ0944377.1 hypothetical protein [Streptomyces sp. V1I1]
MDDPSPQGLRKPAPAGAGPGTAGQPGVIGIALAAVLTASLANGSWQWFATYIGVTLLAVIFCFYRPPVSTPRGSEDVRNLAAYSMVVGLCVAIALAPAMQRWAWLFPMPGTRSECRDLGRYEGLRVEATLANLAGRDSAALARAQDVQSHDVVADCLAATTTLWLPVYGAGAAVLVGLGVWSFERARGRRKPAVAT